MQTTRKELPLLFSTDMVIANEQGIKTNTRRTRNLDEINTNPDNWEADNKPWIGSNGNYSFRFINKEGKPNKTVSCPYGKIGDLLYVREAWCYAGDNNAHDCLENFYIPIYRASDNGKDLEDNADGWTWKPSIHMPKEIARQWLEVLSIHLERLHEISHTDAIEEGVSRYNNGGSMQYRHYLKDKYGPSPIHSFQTLWIKINRAESWDANPWVWVVKYKVLSTNGKPE